MSGVVAPGRLARLRDSDLFYSFTHSPVAMFAAGLALICLVGAAFAPWLAPHDPFDIATLSLLDSFKPPIFLADGTWANALGTDEQGRDVLSAIMYGARVSLVVGASAVVFAMLLGIAIGLVSGFASGIIDALLMRAADIQLTFPAILMALLVDGVIGALVPKSVHDQVQIYVIVFAIGISRWPQFARTVRGSTLVERGKDYVAAARVIGTSPTRIMTTHILPNVLGPVLVIGTLTLGLAGTGRGDVVVSGRRFAGDAAIARDADTDW